MNVFKLHTSFLIYLFCSPSTLFSSAPFNYMYVEHYFPFSSIKPLLTMTRVEMQPTCLCKTTLPLCSVGVAWSHSLIPINVYTSHLIVFATKFTLYCAC